jgi:hypothetical protein
MTQDVFVIVDCRRGSHELYGNVWYSTEALAAAMADQIRQIAHCLTTEIVVVKLRRIE